MIMLQKTVDYLKLSIYNVRVYFLVIGSGTWPVLLGEPMPIHL